MPPFSYAYTPSTLASQIEALMAQGGTSAANAITQAAAAQAAGIQGVGQTYAKGLQQIGQQLVNAPQQYQNWLKTLPKTMNTDNLIGATGGGLGVSPTDYYAMLNNPGAYTALSNLATLSNLGIAPVSGQLGSVINSVTSDPALLSILGM